MPIARWGIVSALLVVPIDASAQRAGWEIEVHAGGGLNSNPNGGTSTLPPPGMVLTEPLTAFPSRRVSSWYFGDGTELLNGAADRFQVFRQFSARVTPLDSVLANPLAERQDGGSLGVRVSRDITPRFAAEFSLDFVSAPLAVTSAATDGIQTTSDSFVAAFEGVLGGTSTGVSSTYTIQDHDGRQLAVTGALNINLTTQGRFIPYVTFGAGNIWNKGDAPVAKLEGHYTFQFSDGLPYDETDTVRIRHSTDDRVVAGVFGGGAKMFLTPRSGIRVDVRVHLSNNTVHTFLNANPDVVTHFSQEQAAFAFTTTDPSVRFSNSPLTGVESSLGGPDIDNFETFTVSGVQSQVLVNIGYFWRP